ncbi:MAG: MBL fold metallo-hydrolase [Betaproteobacteria bacterium]|nr:MBL fold metallo-hydrolase [Betaproteobacteria bacterium]
MLAALLSVACSGALALDVRFQRVADGVWAFVGDKGARTAENEGLNANIGLVVTPAGAVLIDSGATWQSAQKLQAAVRAVTPQPVKWVFNTGGQDHRWLGNGYFAAQGAEIIGHAAGRADMNNRGNDHLLALKAAGRQGRRHGAHTAHTLAQRQRRDAGTRRRGLRVQAPRWRTRRATRWSGCRRRTCSSPVTWSTPTACWVCCPSATPSAGPTTFAVAEQLDPQCWCPATVPSPPWPPTGRHQDYLLALRAHAKRRPWTAAPMSALRRRASTVRPSGGTERRR